MKQVLLAASLAFGASAASAVTVDDLSGDLSGDPLAPTPITFDIGTNTITGQVTTPSDTRDYITFTLPPGQSLVSILLQSYLDGISGGPGNRGYHAISWGPTSAIPGGATANEFLAGAHLDPMSVGSNDLLLQLVNAPLNGTGLTAGPLGPGTYTYVVQQTGPDVSNYQIDFNVVSVVPVPAAGWLMAGLIGLGFAARRKTKV